MTEYCATLWAMDDLLGDQWVGTREAAELTGYTYGQIQYLCKHNRVTCRKILRQWLIDRQSLLEYLAWATEQAKADGRYGPELDK